MTFQVGEKVVYPNHGVGTIENISSRAFGTQSERFYLLRLSPNRPVPRFWLEPGLTTLRPTAGET
jgi:RNA polymerase-interacting CarD/CdnL/TRCF family regulator